MLRVNLYFHISCRPSLQIHQLSISCFQFVILTHNYSTTAGLFLEFLGGELYSQSAEFPFQLSALTCIQNVQLFTHHSGSLAPLWDYDRNADKEVAEWENPVQGGEFAKAKIAHDHCLGARAANYCCSLYLDILFKRITTTFSWKLFAPIRNPKIKVWAFLKIILIWCLYTHSYL